MRPPVSVSGRSHRRLEEQLVHEAPAPVLAPLEAPHDRVLGRMEVLGGMPPRRVIAAPDVTALLAQAEMHPMTARGETLLAACRRLGAHVSHLGEVRTLW